MKNLYRLLFSLCLFAALPITAQNVSNIDWSLDDSQEKIIVTYDLDRIDKYQYFDVTLQAQLGSQTIVPKSVTGDVGTFIKYGKNKKIIWEVFNDINELKGDLSFKVIAVNNVPNMGQEDRGGNGGSDVDLDKNRRKKSSESVKPTAGLGAIVLSGLAVMGTGSYLEINAQKSYDTYKSFRDEDHEEYDEISRDDLYKEANKQHKLGMATIYGGVAIVAFSGYLLVNRMMINKRLDQKFSLSPQFQPSLNGLEKSTVGVGMSFRF